MTLLAIDTSTAQVGLAIYDGTQTLAETTWSTGGYHTVELAPALAGLLSRSQLTMDMISSLGVAIGPGSFTSLRVGLSFVKGLALARRLPVIGIPTLDIVAAAQAASKYPLAVTLQAGRGRLAVGWYHCENGTWRATGSAQSQTADELANVIKKPTHVVGELSAEDRKRLERKRANILLAPPEECSRRPSVLAELAWARWKNGAVDDASTLAPIYLHVAGTPIT